MYSVFRPFLFRMEPERAHHWALGLARLMGRFSPIRQLVCKWFEGPSHPVQAFGLTFKNPIGLAAGYDKDGVGWRGLAALGFSHIEVGTVTLRPQPGNPSPRLFRLVDDQALINRMGFPGSGAEFVLRQLSGPRPKGVILGVNIGKNKETPLEDAGAEYAALVQMFAPWADYLAVNVSSPNTAGLRDLQSRAALESLLNQILEARKEALARMPGKKLPLLVKLAPDLDVYQLEQALDAILSAGIDGVIATNTTVTRAGLRSPLAKENGGLSGAPLFPQSLAMVKAIQRFTNGALPIVAVGGVMNGENAEAMLEAGARLVQVYTGLIYAGPGLVRSVLNYLHAHYYGN